MNSSDHMGASFFRNTPVTPLPNPGEGGPVDSGSNTPVVPLPNPGEGGPVDSGSSTPVIPLPNPGEGGAVAPDGSMPVIPLPNPGEGGPVAPGRPGQTIPILPLPNPPCFFCAPNQISSRVRFLNAAFGYNPFRIFVNNRFIVNGLGYTALTPYGRVSDGFQRVTVTGMNGYIYLQKTLPFRANENVTVAIINTAGGGLDLLQISDTPCSRPANMSCFRTCNLAFNSNPLDVVLADGRVVYSDVRFKEVTAFKRIRPGSYELYLAETDLRPMPRYADIETLDMNTANVQLPEVLVSTYLDVRANATYTLFIFTRENTQNAVQTMVVEDR